jgi:hypothetical protein
MQVWLVCEEQTLGAINPPNQCSSTQRFSVQLHEAQLKAMLQCWSDM